MTVVDTSVWLAYLAGRDNAHTAAFAALVEAGEDVALTGLILTEVLQGIRSDAVRAEALAHLEDFCLLELARDDYILAAEIYRTCRRHGFTVRGTIDCLIAALCLNRGATLLHDDRDFARIATIVGLPTHVAA